jgi:hypothetical protein
MVDERKIRKPVQIDARISTALSKVLVGREREVGVHDADHYEGWERSRTTINVQ